MVGTSGSRSKRQRLVAVLDVGTSRVCCLIAKVAASPQWLVSGAPPPSLKILGYGHHRSSGVKGGVIVHMEPAEEAIRAAVDRAERMAGFMIEEVHLAVACGRLKSDSFSASVALAGEPVGDHDIARVLAAGRDFAARDGRTVLHVIPTGYRLDDSAGIADPRGMVASRLGVDIHTVSADEAPLKNLLLCVERCHLSVAGMAAGAYASALATIAPDEARLGVACIDLGAGTTSLAVFSEGHFVYGDAVAIGGDHVTFDLARTLCTPLAHAERLKTLHGAAFATPSDEAQLVSYPNVGEEGPALHQRATKAQIAEIIRPRMEHILSLVRERLEASGLGAVAGQRVVLTGGASQLTGVAELARRILGKSVRVAAPRPPRGLEAGLVGPSLAAAVGLAMHSGDIGFAAAAPRQGRILATGTGYMSRVGQWIRESF